MNKVVLISMIKNESRIIERCLQSCEKLCDAFCFLDTGSTDNTVEILNKFLETHVGKVYQEPFVNFSVSRTRSFEVCVDFVKSLGWDLDKTYGVLIDGDMVLKYGDTSFKHGLNLNGYHILQINGNLEYDNMRFVKLSHPWKCVGVTHEYWDGQAPFGKIGKEFIYIADLNDGGCKSDKFERDIRLLEKGLEDEPQNKIRYTFYLAQSYENINRQKSIELYKERIALGGWFEEVYIASFRVGDMVEDNKEKVAFYLDAINVDPTRGEAFYRLAKHYRCIGKNNLAIMFATLGKKLGYPKNRSLFLEKEVYEYKFDEEISIAGYYVDGYKPQGFKACDKIIMGKGINELSKNLAFNNEYYYLDKVNAKYIKKITIGENPIYKCSSSSFIRNGDKYLGIQRLVNYSIVPENGSYIMRDPLNYVKTENMLYEFDTNLNITPIGMINIKVPKKRETNIQGLEDMRIFTFKNKVFALATTFEYGDNNHPSQVLCYMNGVNIEKIVPLDYKKQHTQKNWCPFVMNDKICCLYSFEPLRIIEVDENTGACKEIINKQTNMDLSRLRGSTSPIYNKTKKEYTLITHEIHFKNLRNYIHRFLTFDHNWELKQVSLPFFFEDRKIEYVLGLERLNNKFIVHYSTMDNTSNFVEIDADKIYN